MLHMAGLHRNISHIVNTITTMLHTFAGWDFLALEPTMRELRLRENRSEFLCVGSGRTTTAACVRSAHTEATRRPVRKVLGRIAEEIQIPTIFNKMVTRSMLQNSFRPVSW